MNWISWPAPSTTIRDAPIRSARSSQMASNPALCPPDTTSFGNAADASSASGSSSFPDRPPAAEHGHERHCSGDQFGGKSVRIAPHRRQEADDPVLVREILIPEAANVGHECPRSWMVLAQRECAWLQQRQRQSRIGTAGSGEQNAETAIGMTHEVGTIAHEVGDVVGITQEVLAFGRRASPIATPVRHQQAKALLRRAVAVPATRRLLSPASRAPARTCESRHPNRPTNRRRKRFIPS